MSGAVLALGAFLRDILRVDLPEAPLRLPRDSNIDGTRFDSRDQNWRRAEK